MTGIGPGWYPDAEGVVRWWDGMEWTEHALSDTLPPEGPADRPPADDDGGASRRNPLLVAGLGLLVLLVVAGLVVAAGLVGLVGGGEDDSAARTSTVPTSSSAVTTPPATTSPAAPNSPAPSPTPEPAPDPTSDPGPEVEAVADRFINAVIAVDCARIERLSTSAFLDNQGRCDETLPADALAGATFTREPAAVAGASATVMAVITPHGSSERSGPTFRFTLTLVNTALGWQVNDLATAS